MNVAPANITSLAPGEVFVFGSNARGAHAGGAARFAAERFGAIWGQSEGMQGQSYGIDTMSGLDVIQDHVGRLVEFARQNPDTRFLVTEIGCGIAGYTPTDVAGFFAGSPGNVALPDSFHAALRGES